MVIASVILGILFILSGFFCMAAPIAAYFNVMTMLASMMLVFGVFGIIRFFKRRSLVPELIMSILAVIIGFIYLFRPGSTADAGMLMLDRVVLFLEAVWFVVKGSISVYFSINTRFVNDHWILQLITGILSIILGIYSFIFPAIAAQNIGILLGLWFIECGIELIAFGTTAGFVHNAMEETAKEVNRAANQVMHELDRQAKAAQEAVKDIPITSKDDAESNGPAETVVVNAPIEPEPSNEAPETVEVVEDTPEKPEDSAK